MTISFFILAGQSNALGYGSDAANYPKDEALDRRIHFYWATPAQNQPGQWMLGSHSNGWLGMQAQSGIYPSGHFGPEVSLARGALERLPGEDIAVFKFAAGSSSLHRDWRLGNNHGLFASFILYLDDAFRQLRQQTASIKLRGFIWLQGESDAENAEMSNAYEDNLKRLVEVIRRKFGPEIRIVLGVDEQHQWVEKNPEVVRVQKSLVKNDTHLRFVSMQGLERDPTGHLSSQGVLLHGERILNACLEE